MLVVGLTGGIATGKSTVSNTLKDKYKLTIVDADLIARQVVEPGKYAYKRIVDTFSEILDLVKPDKSLNREALGKHVFGNKERLSKLNAIVHPAVKREIFWQIFVAYLKLSKVVILDVPLLFESGLNLVCGKTITVTCDRKIQLDRLLARNPELTQEDAEKRISSQMSNDQRCAKADIVIDNNGELADLQITVGKVVKEVTPGALFWLLDLFLPFGLLSAVLTVASRYLFERFKAKRE